LKLAANASRSRELPDAAAVRRPNSLRFMYLFLGEVVRQSQSAVCKTHAL